MGIYRIKPRFQQALGGTEETLVRHRVHPDYLTIGALILSILGGVALWGTTRALWLFLLIPIVAIGRTALNALDGLVARDTGLARPWGEVLNEFCDRLADVSLFTGAALAHGSDTLLGAAAIVVMLLSSYLAILSKAAGGRRQYGGMMGKADRMIYLSIASVAALILAGYSVMTYFLIVVLVGLVLTIVRRARDTHADLQGNLQPGR
jgi:CDP-diacylglycerol--glycerol-3-phosphate 3-phosphatidyltransferase